MPRNTTSKTTSTAAQATDTVVTDTNPPTEAPRLSDADTLRKLWRLTLEGSIRNLESGEANAAGLNVARQFLADNGVDLRNMQHLDASAWKIDPADLPTFDD